MHYYDGGLVVPVKRYLEWIVVFSAIGILTATFMLFELIQLLVYHHFEIIKSAGYLVWFVISAIYLSWFVNGRESLIFTETHMEVVRGNGWFSIKKRYEKKKINDIKGRRQADGDSYRARATQQAIEKRKAFPFWRDMGQIDFYYGTKLVSILNGLEKDEIDEILPFIKKNLAMPPG